MVNQSWNCDLFEIYFATTCKCCRTLCFPYLQVILSTMEGPIFRINRSTKDGRTSCLSIPSCNLLKCFSSKLGRILWLITSRSTGIWPICLGKKYCSQNSGMCRHVRCTIITKLFNTAGRLFALFFLEFLECCFAFLFLGLLASNLLSCSWMPNRV